MKAGLLTLQKKKYMATKISELGEFGLISRLTKPAVLSNVSSILGIGDDAAVIRNGARDTVVSTDLLLEGIHFDLVYCPLKHLGYKAISVNLSDIYAMNAIPEQVTVSIGVSSKFSVEALELLYEGMFLACSRHGVDMVGGDTSSSVTGLAISITAIGKVAEGGACKRSGAKANDLICVSGDLGAAYLGLQLLEREKRIFSETKGGQPKLEGFDYVLERQLKPEARKDIIEGLARVGILPTAMIDVSDGLSSEMLHICKESGAGARIYQEKLPINEETIRAAAQFQIEPATCALNGGEDYELLFTIDMDDYSKLALVKDVSIIGNITDKSEGCNIITDSGQWAELKAQGWANFKPGE
jgi:thiamine-monophosphate kinase